MQKVDEEIRKIIDSQYAVARKLLEDNRDKVETMAKALLELETIDADQIDDIMSGKPPRTPKDWVASPVKASGGVPPVTPGNAPPWSSVILPTNSPKVWPVCAAAGAMPSAETIASAASTLRNVRVTGILLVNVMSRKCRCARKNMRIRPSFDHKSFTHGPEPCANPKNWIVWVRLPGALPCRPTAINAEHAELAEKTGAFCGFRGFCVVRCGWLLSDGG
jgi:hypothetical protein